MMLRMKTYETIILAGILFIIFIISNRMSLFYIIYIYIILYVYMYIYILDIYTSIERDVENPSEMRHDTRHSTLMYNTGVHSTRLQQMLRARRVLQRQQSTPRKKRCTVQLDVYCREFSLCPDSIWKLKMVSGVWQRQWSSDTPWLQHCRLRGLSDDQGATRLADGRWKHTMESTRWRGRAPHWAGKEQSLQREGPTVSRGPNSQSCSAGTGSLLG